MPLTAEQAVQKIRAKIKEKGKFNVANTLDAIIGVAKDNTEALQELLDKFLKKTGVLTAADEAALAELIKRQEEEKKKRQQLRTRNGIFIVAGILATGTIIYFVAKKKQ